MLDKQIVQMAQKIYKSKSGKTIRLRVRYGAFVAGIDPHDPNRIVIGCSLCHKSDREKYRDDLAIKIAEGKALKWSTLAPDVESVEYEIPYTMLRQMPKFISRCRRYYKDRHFPEWATKIDILKQKVAEVKREKDKRKQ